MDTYAKELDSALAAAVGHFKEELRGMRSNRPSLDFIENIQVNYFDSMMTVKQLGSLTLMPPREIRITLWDKGAVQPVMKAISESQGGFTVSNDGITIHANLASMSAERREELIKLIKKTTEATRIEVRSIRDDIMKKVKAAEDRKELSEDQVRSGKEKLEKRVKEANAEIEALLEKKITEISE